MRLIPPLVLFAAWAGFAAAAGAQTRPAPAEVAPGARLAPGGGQALLVPGVKPPPLPPGDDSFGGAEGARRIAATGTGFVVAPGRLLTNWHVADGCAELRARNARGPEIPATLVARDAERDLALLATQAELGPVLTFRAGPEARRGEGG